MPSLNEADRRQLPADESSVAPMQRAEFAAPAGDEEAACITGLSARLGIGSHSVPDSNSYKRAGVQSPRDRRVAAADMHRKVGDDLNVPVSLLLKCDPTQPPELLRCLGRGSFGDVYLGKDVHGTSLAVKIVPLDPSLSEGQVQSELESEIALMREFDHQNIVQFFDAFPMPRSGEVWVLMELCECGSLQSVCKLIGGSMAEAQLRAVCADVLQGLRYLHEERRTVHRDVKGANVLLTRAGVVKIADFGVSTALDAGGGIQSTVIGSPHWMAPEVISGVGYGTAADIWSLGITLIELVDGQPPYSDTGNPMATMFRIVTGDPPMAQKQQGDGISCLLETFLESCLRKEQSQRPSCDELLRSGFGDASVDRSPLVRLAEEVIIDVGSLAGCSLRSEAHEQAGGIGAGEKLHMDALAQAVAGFYAAGGRKSGNSASGDDEDAASDNSYRECNVWVSECGEKSGGAAKMDKLGKQSYTEGGMPPDELAPALRAGSTKWKGGTTSLTPFWEDDVRGDGSEVDGVNDAMGRGTWRHSSRRRNTTPPVFHVQSGRGPPPQEAGRRRVSTSVLSYNARDGHSEGIVGLSDVAAVELVAELRTWAARRMSLAYSERAGVQDQPKHAIPEAGCRVRERRVSLIAGRRLSAVPACMPPLLPEEPLVLLRSTSPEKASPVHNLHDPRSCAFDSKWLLLPTPPGAPPPPPGMLQAPIELPQPPEASPCGHYTKSMAAESPSSIMSHPEGGLLDVFDKWRSVVRSSTRTGPRVAAARQLCFSGQVFAGEADCAGGGRGDSHGTRSFRTHLLTFSNEVSRSLASGIRRAAWSGRRRKGHLRTHSRSARYGDGGAGTDLHGGIRGRADCRAGTGGSVARPDLATPQAFIGQRARHLDATPPPSVPSQHAGATNSWRQLAVSEADLPRPASALSTPPVCLREEETLKGHDSACMGMSAIALHPCGISLITCETATVGDSDPASQGMTTTERCPDSGEHGCFERNSTRLTAEL